MIDSDELLGKARDNWRVVLLTLLLLISSVAIFAPSTQRDGPTNLRYGLELSGGTRVQAPFIGYTAEDVSLSNKTAEDLDAIETNVSRELGIDRTAVQTRPGQGAVEVYTENVSQAAFTEALREQNLNVNQADIRRGVTEPTRQTAVDVIEDKIRQSPELAGGTVTVVQSATGDHFLQIEVPDANRSQVLELVRSRGQVRVIALFPADAAGQAPTNNSSNATTPTPSPTATASPTTPTESTTPTTSPTDGNGTEEFSVPEGYRAHTLFTQQALDSIGNAQEGRDGSTFVPVTLSEPAGQNFSQAMQKWGFTTAGVGNCQWRFEKENPGYCLITVRDGEVVFAGPLNQGLATDINSGDFTKTNSFQMQTGRNISQARSLEVDLRAGALPTGIDIEEGTVLFVEASLAQRFKLYSLITGIIAAIAVAVVVFGAYRDVRVAAPMFLTALSEVYLLLGFAAAIALPLDLAHIAGFIAVIGTGVDDLIIIADEVMSQGDVRTRRVFQNRFRKAFWVIGAAAITTIIAMSPLTVLSLGDLSGFAIVTIVGVIIGVLVTRPAYGDILRGLMTRGD